MPFEKVAQAIRLGSANCRAARKIVAGTIYSGSKKAYGLEQWLSGIMRRGGRPIYFLSNSLNFFLNLSNFGLMTIWQYGLSEFWT